MVYVITSSYGAEYCLQKATTNYLDSLSDRDFRPVVPGYIYSGTCGELYGV